MHDNTESAQKYTPPSLWGLLKPYSGLIALLVFLTLLSNGLNLAIPRLIADAIDDYSNSRLAWDLVIIRFCLVSAAIFVFTYLQSITQTYASEKVARDLRTRLADKLSGMDNAYIQTMTPAKLLTNLTSDVDAVKTFVSQAIAALISSIFLIVGASVLMLMINWPLALAVLAILPIIAVSFYMVMAKIRKLFQRAQEAIDWLNRVINESILGSALIRLLNSQHYEYNKFLAANAAAKDVSLGILKLFASIIPVINFTTNLAMLIILVLGGHFVIINAMTLGDFTAFNSYLAIIIFPIIIIGFMSNVIAQAAASYQRVAEVLAAEKIETGGHLQKDLEGGLEMKDVSLSLEGRNLLKHISFAVAPGTRTAIIGPTAAGKTQLLYLLTGLIQPSSGSIEYDGIGLEAYDKNDFHRQVGLVFQDSIIFNLTLRENIAFSNSVKDEDLDKAIAAAELSDFIRTLPGHLDTVVSERGTSLSGGQKQRIMLARALALNPRILLLDDFTARLDSATEKLILNNIRRYYPGITLISVTQKIEPIEDYDQIVLLMEGDMLAIGTHQSLLETSPEYVQIFDSQRSTNQYEIPA